MRSLVEQTVEVAMDMRRRLGLTNELPIRVLMGGEERPDEDWRLAIETDQILVGTIDMLLSRALNRGYAESRFAWPVAYGLLNSDCRWVFDEVQLMGPARATSAQLDGLRAKLGTAIACETIWVSATVDQTALLTVDRPELGSVMSLPEEDRKGHLAHRLQAPKTLERIDLTKSVTSKIARSIAELAVERHVTGTRTLVVLNTVRVAQDCFRQLRRVAGQDSSPDVVLLHSRFRPPEREKQMTTALATPDERGTIVVATQVVEAGVDMSARTLITNLAPFSSIVQRLGRCNRAGEYEAAAALWLDTGPFADDASGRKAAAPYLPADLESARTALLDLEGSSLSPSALELMEKVHESTDDPAVLRRRDLLDLFDTSPDLSGMDIDIAPFIREDDERSVSVFFRDLGTKPGPRIEAEPLAAREELVQAPLADMRGRTCWTVDHIDGVWWRSTGGAIPPGSTVMLNASDGGYDTEIGWAAERKGNVEPVSTQVKEPIEGVASDPRSVSRTPQELSAHLQAATDEITDIAAALDIDQWLAPLVAAAALHDLGKAHPVFQATLLAAIDPETYPEAQDRLWAKSGGAGGRHARSNFRHELASALAVSHFNGAIDLPSPPLTTYLIAAHHGKVRLSIRPAPGEKRPRDADDRARFALGIVDGDELPEVETPLGTTPALTLDLTSMELGAPGSWTDAAVALRDDPDLGPFRLAFLEALLRVADWRVSA
jgi:CRISPR-associated endonuclease/helicase Cas3